MMQPLEVRIAVSDAQSMERFCEGQDSFVIGEWREWRKACFAAGKELPPSDFKRPNPSSPPDSTEWKS